MWQFKYSFLDVVHKVVKFLLILFSVLMVSLLKKIALFLLFVEKIYLLSCLNFSEIPAGILQGLFFSTDVPNYLNFGALGYVIAHELIHSVDDEVIFLKDYLH